MECAEIAKVAVSAATYSIDKPYDYLIPEPLLEKAQVGVRVMIPFGMGNRSCEGVILARETGAKRAGVKALESVLAGAGRVGRVLGAVDAPAIFLHHVRGGEDHSARGPLVSDEGELYRGGRIGPRRRGRSCWKNSGCGLRTECVVRRRRQRRVVSAEGQLRRRGGTDAAGALQKGCPDFRYHRYAAHRR